MADLPANVGTGIVRIKIRHFVLQDGEQVSEPVVGRVTFTPTAPVLRHDVDNLLIPSSPTSAILVDGDAQVELVATNDFNLSPMDFTYQVDFALDGESVSSFHIEVPEGSVQDLSDLTPVPAAGGVFYLRGEKGEDGAADEESIADVLGVALVTSSTPPSQTSMYGKPVVWIPDGSTLSPISTTPTAPTFDYATYAVTVPAVVGVEYQVYDPTGGTWLPITGATSLAGYTRPFTAKVRAQALPGYVLTANYEWQALFYTESSLVLWASDGFSGTAGVPLAPPASGTGRAFDMVSGGTAAPAPRWSYTHATIPAGWMTNGSGVAIRDTSAQQDYHNGIVHLQIGAPNYRVEVDVTTPWTGAHGRTFTFTVGGMKVDIAMMTPNTEIAFNTCGPVTAVNYLYGPLAAGPYTGTWKFSYVNRSLRLDSPDGRTWSRDYNAASDANRGVTDKLMLSWADWSGANPGQPPPMDTVRVYK